MTVQKATMEFIHNLSIENEPIFNYFKHNLVVEFRFFYIKIDPKLFLFYTEHFYITYIKYT